MCTTSDRTIVYIKKRFYPTKMLLSESHQLSLEVVGTNDWRESDYSSLYGESPCSFPTVAAVVSLCVSV